MPKQLKGYKVVSYLKRGKQLRSFLDDDFGAIDYKVGKPVKPLPKFGPLCVFTTLEAAKDFWCSVAGITAVYSCLYTRSEETTVWVINEFDEVERVTLNVSDAKLASNV